MNGDGIRSGAVDAYLDPPDDPEWTRPVDVRQAPLSAILRAIREDTGREACAAMMEEVAEKLGLDKVRDICVECNLREVYLTEDEWREAFPPHNPCDPRI